MKLSKGIWPPWSLSSLCTVDLKARRETTTLGSPAVSFDAFVEEEDEDDEEDADATEEAVLASVLNG